MTLVWTVGSGSVEAFASVPGGFALEGGRVVRAGAALECEVHRIPDGIDNGIAFWSVVGTRTSEAVQKEETGIFFFDAGGKCVAFIPLEYEDEYQGLVWSPDGGRLVLVSGSAVRLDVFFTLFTAASKGMEKGPEFSGLRGELAWLDPHRFVLTRIDDMRDTGSSFFHVTALRLSAVLYDAAAEAETVLMGADDTRSYTFLSLTDDGKGIRITELSVPSPKDWDDLEKITERELTLEVPAAG